jgi:hypothetical protein
MQLTLTTQKTIEETKVVDVVLPMYLKTTDPFSKKEYHHIFDSDRTVTIHPFQRHVIAIFKDGDHTAFSMMCSKSELAALLSEGEEITVDEYDHAVQRAIDTLQGMMMGTMTVRQDRMINTNHK